MMAKPQTPQKRGERRYDFHALEEKWRPRWRATELYRTGDDPAKPSIYILDYFPYPSGNGLSVGHCRNYVPTCVSARFHRMRGYNVLHPMGWDAFGLPAENYAVTHGVHPRQTTERFAANYRRQMELVECSYDWSREINSADPAYYRWTQWFFLLLFGRGLAYRAPGSQWWCPQCRTILANEQVEDGRCWRCDSVVTRKELEQWYFRITDYADRLLADLDTVDWPERIVDMQRNWIGRSEGAEVVFTTRPINTSPFVATPHSGNAPDEIKTTEAITTSEEIPVFTTRPDTLFGVTFLALAPEHPLVGRIVTADYAAEVAAYVEAAGGLSEIDRLATDREKSGVFTGAYATHPLSGTPVPIWVADYVLAGYGTGAIMGVPGHDARDFDFARRYDLPVIEVVSQEPPATKGHEPSIFTDEGTLINSGPFDGQPSAEAGAAIAALLAARQQGGPRVTYRLRDWLISRQRYWGAPIPIIHCPACGAVPVPEADLPSLFESTFDFVSEALLVAVEDHHTLDVRTDASDPTFLSIATPPDLARRLSALPQSYLSEQGVAERLRITADPTVAQRRLDVARASTDSAWPDVAYLSPLHPLIDWLVDKLLVMVGRNQAPVIRAGVDSPTFCVQGMWSNGQGRPQLVEWLAVTPGSDGTHRIEDLFEVLRRADVGPGMANTGEPLDTAPLSAQLASVLEAGREELTRRRSVHDGRVEALLAEPTERLREWVEESSQLASQLDDRRRGQNERQVAEVRADTEALIASLRTTGDPMIRVLAVLVPS